MDHIIPLSKGGEHSEANIQLAHMICNGRKSDGTAVKIGRQMSML